MVRNFQADFIKCFSIIGVVFIHSSNLFGANEVSRMFVVNIFSFAVPCFVILWAYFFYTSYDKRNKTQKKEYIVKRFLDVFRVFFIWSFFYFLISVDWNDLTLRSLITRYFSGYGWPGQYFFIVLLQLIVLFPFILKLYAIKWIRICIIVLIVITYIIVGYFIDILPSSIQKLGDRPFVFWLPYVFLGIELAKNNFPRLNKYSWVCVVFIPVEFSILEYFGKNHSQYITLTVLVSSSLFCISILQQQIIINSKIKHLIGFLGVNTLAVYILNPISKTIMYNVLEINKLDVLSIGFKFVFPYIATSMVLFISVLIYEFIKKINLDKLIL
ncbi:acyltransferase family protein [Wenyingzhuangia sp. IMCC45574]